MPLKRNRQPRNLQGIALFLVTLVAIGLLLLRDRPPALEVSIPLDTNITPTSEQPSWQEVLQQEFVANATPLPAVEVPAVQFVPPTLPPSAPVAEFLFQPTELFGTVVPTNTPLPPPPSPTRSGPVVFATPTSTIEAVNVLPTAVSWQPPPLRGPLSIDPRDHYWLARPVDSNAVNFGTFNYPYGSDGPFNTYRVHHGLDMVNPIGEIVRAAGPGIVLWAATGFRVEAPDGTLLEGPVTSYGNAVLIQHDFSYRGQPIYTLYAHLSAILVARGQQVATGDIIGLVGETGQVTGPHVHFEVRLGRNSWWAVRNPVLWMVPYVGHGTIAGRVFGPDGELLADQDISVIDRQTGRIVQTTTSYIPADINQDGVSDINPDNVYGENFAVGEIPEGRFRVVTRIDGQQVSRAVDVFEGTTTFVELNPPEEATPQVPVGDSS